MTGLRRKQTNEVFAMAEIAMLRAGFRLETRAENKALGQKYFVKAGHKIDYRAAQSGDEISIVFRRIK